MSQLRTNREICSHQILDCLSVLGSVSNCLSMLDETTTHETTGGARDGECPKLALENSIIRACYRLDSILDDSARWLLPGTDGHDIHLIAGNAQAGVLAEQHTAVRLNTHALLAALALPDEELAPAPPQRRKKKRKK